MNNITVDEIVLKLKKMKYKGKTDIDAAAYYCPYVPMTVSNVIDFPVPTSNPRHCYE